MIKNKIFYSVILILLLNSFYKIHAQSQPASQNDVEKIISLDEAISLAIKSHPSIKISLLEINRSDEQIALSQTLYFPDVDIDVKYSRVGPAPVLDFPGMGSFKLFPEDNFDAGLKIRENIYDFGRNEKQQSIYESDKKIAEMNIEKSKQEIAGKTIYTFFTLQYLQQAIKIKSSEITTLDEHIKFIQTKQETGSATNYDILATKVKKSVIESAKSDLVSAFNSKLAEMRSLLGYGNDRKLSVGEDVVTRKVNLNSTEVYDLAYANRDEIKTATEELNRAELKVKSLESDNNPYIGVMLIGGFKNGYLPDLNEIKANFVAGVNLSVPLYDGTRTTKKADIERISIESKKEEIELIKRKINNDITSAKESILAAQQKVDQSVLQAQNAEAAYKLAEINYKAGGITNLELLDAETAVSESELAVLKSKIDLSLGLYKFSAVIGERLY